MDESRTTWSRHRPDGTTTMLRSSRGFTEIGVVVTWARGLLSTTIVTSGYRLTLVERQRSLGSRPRDDKTRTSGWRNTLWCTVWMDSILFSTRRETTSRYCMEFHKQLCQSLRSNFSHNLCKGKPYFFLSPSTLSLQKVICPKLDQGLWMLSKRTFWYYFLSEISWWVHYVCVKDHFLERLWEGGREEKGRDTFSFNLCFTLERETWQWKN